MRMENCHNLRHRIIRKTKLGSSNSEIINILDVIQLVGEILGLNFTQSVQWLEENFPELNTMERLSKLDKSKYFTK